MFQRVSNQRVFKFECNLYVLRLPGSSCRLPPGLYLSRELQDSERKTYQKPAREKRMNVWNLIKPHAFSYHFLLLYLQYLFSPQYFGSVVPSAVRSFVARSCCAADTAPWTTNPSRHLSIQWASSPLAVVSSSCSMESFKEFSKAIYGYIGLVHK